MNRRKERECKRVGKRTDGMRDGNAASESGSAHRFSSSLKKLILHVNDFKPLPMVIIKINTTLRSPPSN